MLENRVETIVGHVKFKSTLARLRNGNVHRLYQKLLT